MENKWKKLKIIQRICMVAAILSWVIVVMPVILDLAGAVRIRLYFAQHAWILPVFGLLALGLTAADFLVGYRVYAHENREKHPIVHRKKRRKK